MLASTQWIAWKSRADQPTVCTPEHRHGNFLQVQRVGSYRIKSFFSPARRKGGPWPRLCIQALIQLHSGRFLGAKGYVLCIPSPHTLILLCCNSWLFLNTGPALWQARFNYHMIYIVSYTQWSYMEHLPCPRLSRALIPVIERLPSHEGDQTLHREIDKWLFHYMCHEP